MTQKEVTEINVDDYIRERINLGATKIHWSRSAFPYFRSFVESALSCGIGWDINVQAMLDCHKNHTHFPKEKEFTFMGVAHLVPNPK